MKTRAKWLCLPAAALWIASAGASLAQSETPAELNKRSEDLYRAARKIDEALALTQKAIALGEKTLAPDDPALAVSLTDLGTLYNAKSRYREAETALTRALAIFEKVSAPGDPEWANCLNSLGLLYVDQNKYELAESSLKRSLEFFERANGHTDPRIVAPLANLGLLYINRGDSAAAEPLLKRALEIQGRTYGTDNADYAAILGIAGNGHYDQKRYADAELSYQRALDIWGHVLDKENLEVANLLVRLGAVYVALSRNTDAETAFKRAVAIKEKDSGADDLWLATSLSWLAMVYEKEGRFAEAEPLYKRGLEIEQKITGGDNSLAVKSLDRLASVYYSEGRFTEAEPLYKREIEIQQRTLSIETPSGASSLNRLASVYDSEGRYAEAEPLYKRAITIQEKTLGTEQAVVALSLHSLAWVYYHQGRNEEAERLLKRALRIRIKVFGKDSLITAASAENLALIYEREHRYAEAKSYYKTILHLRETALGPEALPVSGTLNDMAILYADEGHYDDAEQLYRRSIEIQTKILGSNHSKVANVKNNLASLYLKRSRFADAENLYLEILAALESAFGENHPSIAAALNSLAYVYGREGRPADALKLVQRSIDSKTAATWAALPALFQARSIKLISDVEALDKSLNVIQQASQTGVAQALNSLAVRFSAGNSRLAGLVRKEQDLAALADKVDHAASLQMSRDAQNRDAALDQKIKDYSAAITKQRAEIQDIFAKDFPDYVQLAKPQPISVRDIQALLADDEALIIVSLGKPSYVWAVTKDSADWRELPVGDRDVSATVTKLRSQLNPEGQQQFEPKISFDLYQAVLAPLEPIFKTKRRLSFVLSGALTSLPPQVLVTSDPTGKPFKEIDWFVRQHSVTILPSVESLKVLRTPVTTARADKPLIGFADPVFDRTALQHNAKVAANIATERGLRGKAADVSELAAGLPPLPETAQELRRVAASLNASQSDIFLGADATETRVKKTKLDQYRIVYFATHGLVAGEVAEFAKLKAEPALVLTLPERPTLLDDGLLTASEVANLKLNADWVVLSACNTASGGGTGAEALSGLAKAFFYAGGRSLLVSHWPVESNSTVALMTGTFAAIAADPNLSHGEALRIAMLAMIDDAAHPYLADPKFWAPFVVVGEPAKPAK